MTEATAITVQPLPSTQEQAGAQSLKKAVHHFAEFFDATFDRLYGYLFWSTGSIELTADIVSGVYFDAAKKSRRLFLRPELTIALLLKLAEHHLQSLRKKGQGYTVEFSLLQAVEAQCSSLLAQDREIKRREIAALLQCLLTLEGDRRRALILADLLQWEGREIAHLLGLRKEQFQKLLSDARSALAQAHSATAPFMDTAKLLKLLACTLRAPQETRSTIRVGVIEQCSHLRTTQVHLLVLLGTGAVIANTLVSTVVAIAVVTDPLKPLQENTRPQLAAIDAQLIEERIGALQARIELSTLRADADVISVKKRLKDDLVAYGVLTIQEEVERRSGGLAFLEPLRKVFTAVLAFMRGGLL
jgi:DNA-directed RNA polymerase specialized sigma24 family protein